jgi:RNA polymerase sigma factor (sigma-70 family)
MAANRDQAQRERRDVTRPTDAELMAESLVDVRRFGEIFDRHAHEIFRFLGRRIGPDDAGDLLSDVFLAAFEARARYDRDRPSALPWLYGIASNLLSKHYRHRASELRVLERLLVQNDPRDHADTVTGWVDAQVQLRAMAKLLEELPANERDTLLLYAWEDLSYSEIAAALGVPTGTVRSRLNRVRQRLRAATDELDGVRSIRPDRLAPLPDAPAALFDREKERLMHAIDEGKTKIIIEDGDGTVLIRSKDDITAGDGEKHDVIDGKAASSTTTTCNVFRLLADHGVPTHFVEQVDAVTFRARRVEMIPLELVARRIATGSFLDRYPDIADGTVFADLVFEVFEKDDANHDPLLGFDFANDLLRRYVPNTLAAASLGARAGDLANEEPLSQSRFSAVTAELLERLRELTVRTFEIVEQAWAALGGTYFDFKIECGFDVEHGTLLVADVIDSDSGRLRFGDRDMSKQAYRDGSQSLPDIKKNFDEVARLTEQFV